MNSLELREILYDSTVNYAVNNGNFYNNCILVVFEDMTLRGRNFDFVREGLVQLSAGV